MAVPKAIVVGTIVGVLSSATQAVGLALQRRSHVLEEQRAAYRPPHYRPMWRCGFVLFLAANLLGSSVQITTLPLLILSPLQAVGLVFNAVCAAVILEEGFALRSLVGTALVAVGALLIAFYGAVEVPAHSLPELLILLRRSPFVSWLLISGVVVFGAVTAVATVSSHGLSAVVRGGIYGAASGTLSAHSLLFAKCTVELVLSSFLHSNYEALGDFRAWLIVSSFLVLAITQLVLLNKGLRTLSTSSLYPLIFCVYNVTNIVNGLVFYDQLHVLSGTRLVMIVLGTLLVLSGVFYLSWRLDEEEECDNNETCKYDGLNVSIRTPLIGGRSLLDDDEEGAYVSFMSPRIAEREEDGDLPTVAETTPFNSPTSKSTGGGFSPRSKRTGYGALHDHSKTRGKYRSKSRQLSYEQNELLTLLNQMPDMV